jgi:alpha-D-xyloside xylohydrolase
MKKAFFILLGLIPAIALGQTYQKHTLYKDRLSIQLSEGVLNITPLSDNTIRVQFEKELPKEEQEFVLINKQPVPQFKLFKTPFKLKIITKNIVATFDKRR